MKNLSLKGGVRPSLYDTLPRPLISKTGFQGCIASFETNGELLDPIKDALVPSSSVEEGCEGTFFDYSSCPNPNHLPKITDKILQNLCLMNGA